ncbi:MAG: MerR family transcriptional regulator [Actinoplanes sp.]
MTSNLPAAEPAVVPRRPREPGAVSLLNPDARDLARAATDLDAEGVIRIVQAAIDRIGVVSAWEQLVQPVWQYLSSRTEESDERAASEHLYVQSAMTALASARRPPRFSPPSVLLACADEELQVFPLEALVAALEESGASCCVLGARVPAAALASAAERLRPAAVIIWSQTRATADPGQIVTVLDACPATTVVAAGPGWHTAYLPPRSLRSTDLSTALVLTLAILEGATT